MFRWGKDKTSFVFVGNLGWWAIAKSGHL